jgi:RpiR family carbohydrate utilization transcriptional regulator
MSSTPSGRLRSVDALSIIEQRLPALNGASRRVGEAIVSDPWAILGMTIYDVAAKAGVSLPSVTRFCRAVGYNGFRELVQGIAQSLGRLDTHAVENADTPNAETEGLPGLAARIVNRQIDALRATLSTIDFHQVELAVQALCKARRVYTVGHGSAYVSALGTAIKLNWSGLAAVAATPDLFSNLLISVDENDVVISISNQGRTKDVIEMQEVARECGATTISISLVEHSPLSKASDIPIVVLSPELARAGTFLVSYNSLLVVGDILANEVAQRMWGGVPPHLEGVSDWMEVSLRVGPLPANAQDGPNRVRRRLLPLPATDAAAQDDGA